MAQARTINDTQAKAILAVIKQKQVEQANLEAQKQLTVAGVD